MKSLLRETQKLFQILKTEASKDQACATVTQMYKNLPNDQRQMYIRALSRKHGMNSIDMNKKFFSNTLTDPSRYIRNVKKVRDYLTPSYRLLFLTIGREQQGIKFLVDLRSDIFTMKEKYSDELDKLSRRNPSNAVELSLTNILRERDLIESMSTELHDLFTIWFTKSMFQMQLITWNSSCSMLMKISTLEAVHRFESWQDLKQRLGPYRRCYVLVHPCMPDEPVVILHTALTKEIVATLPDIQIQSTGMSDMKLKTIVDVKNEEDPTINIQEDKTNIKSAVFYSISAPHKGLSGIDLGYTMIQSAVVQLRQEFPQMTEFATLSNITGFRPWLLSLLRRQINLMVTARLTSVDDKEITSTFNNEANDLLNENDLNYLQTIWKGKLTKKDCLVQLVEYLECELLLQLQCQQQQKKINKNNDNEEFYEGIRVLLMRLSARYLCLVKRHGFAQDRVANFHLKNGAIVWRINWMADCSARGMGLAYGLMVNYLYDLEQIETNALKYQNHQNISVSNQVQALLLDK